jgi:hypothetical protein
MIDRCPICKVSLSSGQGGPDEDYVFHVACKAVVYKSKNGTDYCHFSIISPTSKSSRLTGTIICVHLNGIDVLYAMEQSTLKACTSDWTVIFDEKIIFDDIEQFINFAKNIEASRFMI